MTTIFIVLYEATPRHCCGTEYESNYIFQYLIWACNHLTTQSALTSLKNTKGQIHPLVPGGSAIRDWDEKSPGLLFLCSACSVSGSSSRKQTIAMLLGVTPFPHLAFEKVQKPTREWEMNRGETWCSGFLSGTCPLHSPVDEPHTPEPAREVLYSFLANIQELQKRSRTEVVYQREK